MNVHVAKEQRKIAVHVHFDFFWFFLRLFFLFLIFFYASHRLQRFVISFLLFFAFFMTFLLEIFNVASHRKCFGCAIIMWVPCVSYSRVRLDFFSLTTIFLFVSSVFVLFFFFFFAVNEVDDVNAMVSGVCVAASYFMCLSEMEHLRPFSI